MMCGVLTAKWKNWSKRVNRRQRSCSRLPKEAWKKYEVPPASIEAIGSKKKKVHLPQIQANLYINQSVYYFTIR